MFWTFAHAQAAAAAATPEQPNALLQMLPFVLMIGVFYFLVMRPQAKRQRDTQSFLGALKHGDEVLTTGGMLGRIEGLTDMFVTLEVAPSVRVKVLRSQIAGSTKGIEAKKDK